jgi:ABC-type sugar transport system ATPase subunit
LPTMDAPSVTIAAFDIAKRFGHVQALSGATVVVHPREIVALCGDNGAGKSTLLKTLIGVVQPDHGDIVICDERVSLSSISDAQARGVDCVHQDLAQAPDLSVVDMMYLGHPVLKRGIGGRLGILARKEMAERADSALRELGIRLPSLTVPIRELSGGQRQAVAVARAVMWSNAALLLDEPTAALGVRQSDMVDQVMLAVAERGLGVLVVSHDIPRVLKVANRITVLSKGRSALDQPASDLTLTDVVATMVGQIGDVA